MQQLAEPAIIDMAQLTKRVSRDLYATVEDRKEYRDPAAHYYGSVRQAVNVIMQFYHLLTPDGQAKVNVCLESIAHDMRRLGYIAPEQEQVDPNSLI